MYAWTTRVLFLALTATSTVSQAADLRAQTSRLLEYWTGKAAGDKRDASAAVPQNVLQSFDYEGFATQAIENHKGQLTTAQLKKYREVFDQLLRKTVHKQAGAALTDTRYVVGQPKESGDRSVVEVKAHLPKDDLDTTVEFVWAKRDGAWRITDVVIDGSSLVKDYSNQFGRILKKDGPTGLLGKLEKRLLGASEESARL